MKLEGGEVLLKCRICLGERPDIDIHKAKERGWGVALPCTEIMLVLFTLRARQNDGLPQKLCRKCYNKLMSAYKLKLLAEHSYKRLLECVAKQTSEDIIQSAKVAFDSKDDIKHENEIKIEVDECLVNTSIGGYEKGILLVERLSTGIASHTDSDKKDIDCEEDSEDNTPLAYYNADNKPLPDSFDDEKIMETKQNDTKKENEPPDNKAKKISEGKIIKRKDVDKVTVAKKKNSGVCDICGKLVNCISRHFRTHSNERRMYKCTLCPKIYLDQSTLKRHRITFHLGKRYFCEICNKSFKKGTDHIRSKHSNHPKTESCVSCDKKFSDKSRLGAHMKIHTKENLSACEICGKTFGSKNNCVQHMKRVHEKEKSKICQICSKAFFSESNLRTHIKTHTKEKLFKCSECDKSFIRKCSLDVHVRRHFGIKKYPCQVCGKKFVCSGALGAHMVCHDKTKVYPCKFCGTTFGRKDNKKTHERTVHKEIAPAYARAD